MIIFFRNQMREATYCRVFNSLAFLIKVFTWNLIVVIWYESSDLGSWDALMQFWKSYTEFFNDRIKPFEHRFKIK